MSHWTHQVSVQVLDNGVIVTSQIFCRPFSSQIHFSFLCQSSKPFLSFYFFTMCRSNQAAKSLQSETAKIGTRGSTFVDTSIVPTIKIATAPKKLNVKDITSSEALAALKTSDPFMYFSVPSLRCAAFHDRPVDLSELAALTSDGTPSAGSVGSSKSQVVTRRTIISTECHPNVLLFGGGDLFEQMFDGEGTDDEDSDGLYEFLASRQ